MTRRCFTGPIRTIRSPISRAVLKFTSALLVLFCCWCAAWTEIRAQTQEQVDQVAKITGRPQTKSSTLSFLAGYSEQQGQYEKAAALYKEMAKLYAGDPSLGPKCAKYAWVLTKQALCYKALKDDVSARSLCGQAQTIVDGITPNKIAYEREYLRVIDLNLRAITGLALKVPNTDAPASAEKTPADQH